MSNINTMIDRAGLILDYLYQANNPAGVSKISADLDLPKATVFRILTTLEKWHIVEKHYLSDDYKLGLALIKYGAKASQDISLVKIAKPIIEALAADLNEIVNLNIEHQNYCLNIYTTSNGNSTLTTNLIPISPLNCSASGKIFLSQRSDKAINDYIHSDLCEKRTINSIVDFNSFMAEKNLIKSNGFAYDDEEYEYGLFCISMPLYYKSKIVAALSITGPKTRLEIKGLDMIEEELKSACEAVTEIIQYIEMESLILS